MNAKVNWVTLQRQLRKVLCLLLCLSFIGRPLWYLCKCQAEFDDITKITEATVSFGGGLSCR